MTVEDIIEGFFDDNHPSRRTRGNFFFAEL